MPANPQPRSLDDLPGYVARMEFQIRTSLQIAAMRTADKALKQAIKRSSGPVKASAMRKDRPFARRHPRPLLPADILNAQTGGFRDDWRATTPSAGKDGSRTTLSNMNPVTTFFQGTRWMHERPIADRLAEEVEAIATEEAQHALSRMFE